MKYIDKNGIERDSHNNVNQDILDKFVSKHVYANVSSLVEFSLKNSYNDEEAPITYDDIENFCTYPEFSGKWLKFHGGNSDDRQIALDEADELIEKIEERISLAEERDDDFIVSRWKDILLDIESEKEKIENLDEEASEVFQWFIVSGFLVHKLKEDGQVVCEYDNIWGRQTFGQHISLDGVISRIAIDMKILEGQNNSWEVK